jgi:hypothetical protein
MTQTLINTGGGNTLEHQHFHDPLPTLPFRLLHFPLFAPPGHTNKHEHKSLLIISKKIF